jgi:hypothetical protein
MYNEDVLDLYPRVPVGTVVTVTWERFKTGPAALETASTPPSTAGGKAANIGRKNVTRTKTVSVQ